VTATEDDGVGLTTDLKVSRQDEIDIEKNYRCRTYTPLGRRGNVTATEDDGVGLTTDLKVSRQDEIDKR
jgi:hypothetical protein